MNSLFGFLITFLVELGVYFIFIRKKRVKKINIVLYCFLINAITWPIAMLVSAYINIFILEFLVFAAESFLILLIFEIGLKKAVLISLVANLITASIGFFISNL